MIPTDHHSRDPARRTAELILMMKALIMLSLGVGMGITFMTPCTALASTNISANPAEHWAWNDVIGWIDFFNTLTVNVQNAQLTGYASSSVGDISLDCATTRIGNICGPSPYKVSNDGTGNLSGWAWNDTYGWISFCGGAGTADCPGSSAVYQVMVDPSSGIFTNLFSPAQGYAWNDAVGWISFNCDTTGCGTSDYAVVTSWVASSTVGSLDSTTYDTGISSGAQINSVLWQGSQPGGTAVRFQFAVSNNSNGPWAYQGPDGTAGTYYYASPGVTRKLDYALHAGARYFRYRVMLVSDPAQTLTPRVNDIYVNWSP